jgi:hypothetical protein
MTTSITPESFLFPDTLPAQEPALLHRPPPLLLFLVQPRLRHSPEESNTARVGVTAGESLLAVSAGAAALKRLCMVRMVGGCA